MQIMVVKTGARSLVQMWIILALGAVAFFLFLGRTDIVTSHEARVAQSARMMAATGWPWGNPGVDVPAVEFYHDPDGRKFFRHKPGQAPLHVNPWLIPVAAGEIRLQKPPLPYWMAGVFYRWFHYNEFYSRLPSAIMGLGATFLMIDLARRLMSNRAALWAGLIWISTLFIIDSYRKAMADPGLAFFTLLCFWCWVRYCRGTSAWVLMLFYVSLALGTYAKGPVIYLHLLIAITLFAVCYREWPRGMRQWLWHGIGTALVLVVFLPWPLRVMHRVPHALDLWRYESVGEFADNVEDARPWWFYLPNIFLIPAPWTAVGILGSWRTVARFVKRRKGSRYKANLSWLRAGLFPLLWIIFTVLIFSFSNLKKNMYLLPMMPAVVMLCVQGVFTLSGFLRLRQLRPIAVIIMAGMAIAVLVVASLSIHAAHGLIEVDVIAIPAIALAILAIVRAIQGRLGRWILWQSVAGALAVTAFVIFYSGTKDNLRSARPLADAVLPMLKDPDLAFHNVPIEVSVYLPLDLPDRPRAPRQLIFTRTLRHGADAYQNQTPDQQIVQAQTLHFAHISKINPWKTVILTVKPN